ncbi:MAG TPA: guanylate kinase [Bacteroidales bacterium]|nr:guanylate kinase [Bacteroidales bacterium]HRZ49413.1 guanylate kinase [Bacteroidales bacterium]
MNPVKPIRGKLIILSAPSGAGKTTIVKSLMQKNLNLRFSVSATTRKPREGEIHGRDYYFLSENEFGKLLAGNAFVEHEEVYEGLLYGTLKSEVDRILATGSHALFDIDVMGGISIKEQYGEEALAVFIMPPGLGALKDRLVHRGTETEESLAHRIEKARWELSFSGRFDVVVVNDHLDDAIELVAEHIRKFTGQ